MGAAKARGDREYRVALAIEVLEKKHQKMIEEAFLNELKYRERQDSLLGDELKDAQLAKEVIGVMRLIAGTTFSSHPVRGSNAKRLAALDLESIQGIYRDIPLWLKPTDADLTKVTTTSYGDKSPVKVGGKWFWALRDVLLDNRTRVTSIRRRRVIRNMERSKDTLYSRLAWSMHLPIPLLPKRYLPHE